MQRTKARPSLAIRAVFALMMAVSTSLLSHSAMAENITYYHNDLLGSPVMATDQSGTVIWREDYEPYGKRLQNQAGAATNTQWYTGKSHDNDTGLTYMGARYYDPRFGRFLAVDPVDFTEANLKSFNRYTYANNNPYTFTDPDGNSPIDVIFFAADAVKLVVAINSGNPAAIQSASADLAASTVGLISPIPGTGQAIKAAKAADKINDARIAARSGGDVAAKGTETVQRGMSRAELKATQETGLLRGGRDGTHFVSDAVNSTSKRAQQRLALPQGTDVRVTMEVPKGAFSKPSKVKPAFGMPGGGMERTATGKIPVTIKRVDGM